MFIKVEILALKYIFFKCDEFCEYFQTSPITTAGDLCRNRVRDLCTYYYIFFLAEWNLFVIGGYLLVGGYLINYLPFFPADKTLFVHSYLPALLYKIIIIPVFANHFNSVLLK